MARKTFWQLVIMTSLAWSSDPVKAQVSSGGVIATPSAVMDFANAGQTIPARKLSTDPSTCTVGEQYFNTTSTVLKVCTVTNTWTTFTPAGTSGGIPYFPAANALASSAMLAADGVVVGGGNGAAPKTTGVTIDASNNIATTGTVSTGAGGTARGKVAMGELPSNGGDSVGWEAPDLITASLSLVFPNANPGANNIMLFPAPTSGQSQFAWTTFASTNLTDTANLLRNNQANTYSAGDQNFSAAASLEVPVAAGLSATVNGRIGYDSTGNQLHASVNSADAIIPTRATSTPASGNCVKWGSNGQLQDQGAACGTAASVMARPYSGGRRWYWGAAKGGSTSLVDAGSDTGSGGGGTLTSNAADSTHNYNYLRVDTTTTSDSTAGFGGSNSAIAWRGRVTSSPYNNMHAETKVLLTDHAQSNQRFFFGLSDSGTLATQLASDNPADQNYFGILFNPATNSGNWSCVTNNGGASPPAPVDTTVATDALTHVLTIDFDDAAGTATARLDGSTVLCTVSSNLPTASTNLRWMIAIKNVSVSASRRIEFNGVYVEANN